MKLLRVMAVICSDQIVNGITPYLYLETRLIGTSSTESGLIRWNGS